MNTTKIGIITFQRAKNYGALLQAYALKKVLSDLGNTAHIINYHLPKNFHMPSQKASILKTIYRWIEKTSTLYFKRFFEQFREQYLTDMPPVYPHDLAACAQAYDKILAGSDQIFNVRITLNDTNYFLSFAPSEKCASYASSFGLQLSDLSAEERNFMQKNLNHLSHLSVRERQGADIVKALTGREAQVHLDPTLLLTKDKWTTLAVAPKKLGSYVLLYMMYKDMRLTQFARELAQKKGMKLLYISSNLDIHHRVPVQHITPTPQEWLGLFLNAAYVVTNSFHGLAFCINFNKSFFLGRLPEKMPVNSRLDNLLEITGLQDRIYTNFTTQYDKPIAWDEVNKKLEQQRQKALAYLQEITK